MSATEAQVILMWRKSVELYETVRFAGAVMNEGTSWHKSVADLDTDMDALLKGTQLARVKDTVSQARLDMVRTLLGASGAFQAHTSEYAKAASLTGDSFDVLWPLLVRYFMENGKRVVSRGLVFGTPAAGGSNAGNATVNRLNFDAWGSVRENQTPDAKLLRCTRDTTKGTALGEEEFSIEGATAGRDALEELGSGKRGGPIASLSARTSQSYGVQNPSFSTATPTPETTAPTDLGGWTSSITVNATNYQVLTSSTPYRAYEGDTTPAYLRCLATAFTISQNLDTNGASFDDATPYYVHVAVRRQSSADGTLTLTLGRVSTAIDLTTLTNNVWTLVKIAGTSASWSKNFGQVDLTLSIARSAGTTGTVDLDDVVLGPYSPFDGGFYAIVGGATATRLEDKFTFTDQELGGGTTLYNSAGRSILAGLVQRWLWRRLGLYLPACPVPPTANLLAADGGAGALSAGTYSYVVTFVDVNGVESGPQSSVSGGVYTTVPTQIVLAASHRTNLTNVPTGFSSTVITKRRIYRTAAGGSTYFLLTTINDNSTTTFADNVSDATLTAGTQMGSQQVTLSDPP
jgi:hypothetical protein